MTCQLRDRIERLVKGKNRTTERLAFWHESDTSLHNAACVTLIRDGSDEPTGSGHTICEALDRLEKALGLEPMVGCSQCDETQG